MKERSLYLHGLTVGPDVGRGPVGQTLDMKSVSLSKSILLAGRRPVLKQNVHPQLLRDR